ncbi:MarR family winged helix-turn-helix transcriptional regulator [Chryseobacterium viscerum]|uniref:MarR family winged helix-turn-helix transcriptional regulator n=1 Tax=Chryseobacterium viscerum TaxID=1037377 RepID=UPI002222A86C|nr:MarR family transcriptional regulator [Chryseobacterium viscerum]MCW1964329.1 MarR family transcriptional regulator [Chryseobacterium viscerum]
MKLSLDISTFQEALPRKVSNLQSAIRNRILADFAREGIHITLEMYLVLRCLWEKDGRNQQEISDILYRDKASLTNLIDNLEKRNLVVRVQNQNDRRNKNIFLTEEGRGIKDKVIPMISNILLEIENSVSENDLVTTITVLDTLFKKLK